MAVSYADYQAGAGEVELFGAVFQNIGQLRNQLGQLNGFPYLIYGGLKYGISEKFPLGSGFRFLPD